MDLKFIIEHVEQLQCEKKSRDENIQMIFILLTQQMARLLSARYGINCKSPVLRLSFYHCRRHLAYIFNNSID